MAELQDYSGPLKTDLRWEDFSKEALIKLMHAYCRCFVGIMGCWNTVDKMHMPSLTNEQAQDIVDDTYKMVAQYFEYPLVKKAANLEGDDVITMIKLFQILPDGNHGGLYKAKYDIKNRNDVVITFTECPSLEYYERKGRGDLMKVCCQENGSEEKAFNFYGHLINPKIKVEALKYPPRKNKNEIACKWHFYIPK